MNTSIVTKSGFTSAYGFMLGYVQKVETAKVHKELYMEGGIYHVRSYRNNVPALHTDFSGGRASHAYNIWESFEKLADAKSLFIRIA